VGFVSLREIGVLEPEQLVGLLQAHQVVLECGGAHSLGAQFDVAPLEAPVGFGESVLQETLEASFGIMVEAATAFGLFGALLALAQGGVEGESSEGDSGGEDGATAEGVPEGVGVHGCARFVGSASKARLDSKKGRPSLCSAAQDPERRCLVCLPRTYVLSIVSGGLGDVQYPEQRRQRLLSILGMLFQGAMHATDPTSLDPHALGQRIATLRHANGWSQRRLAEAAGVSHGYIALLELGRLPSPGKFRLDAVARALNVRTSDALLAAGPLTWEVSDDDADAANRFAQELPSHEPLGRDQLSPEPLAHEPLSREKPAGESFDRESFSRESFSREPLAGEPIAHAPLAAGSPPPDASALRADGSPAFGPATGSVARTADSIMPTTSSAPGVASALPPTASVARVAQLGNVLGSLEQLRSVGARPLPVFRWGACGDPRDQLSPPDPDRLEYPPPGRETLIGPSGFGVIVKGDSMAARGIHDGDLVWVNPERPYSVGKVVLALVSDIDGEVGEAGMVVKTFARTEVGECLLSETAAGRSPVVCHEFKVIGPVVGITSWRLPS
jgi:SOS-response transcriptional repressor LexA/transcriptional regulator with XRE-family HTH domain